MGEVASVRYCQACGGELPVDARFCAHCGSVQDVDQESSTTEPAAANASVAGEESDSSRSSKRTGVKIAIGVVLVAVLAGVAVLVASLASGSGPSNTALVFEPNRDGNGDIYVVGALGDPYDREDRVLSDVSLDGSFSEAISATIWAGRRQADFDIDGNRLIAYREDASDEITIGLVDRRAGEVLSLVDGKGWLTISKVMSGGVFARFADGDRCVVYRIDSLDEVERLGRGNICEVGTAGSVAIIDRRSNRSDIAVYRSDGTVVEFETRDLVTRALLSPNGALLTASIVDADTEEPIGFRLFDIATGDLLDEMRATDAYSLWIPAALDTGTLVTVSELDGGQILYSLTADGAERLAEGDRVDARIDPTGSRAFVRVTYWDDEAGEYSIWDGVTGNLGEAIEVDLNVENPFGWADAETALLVDPDGNVVGVDVEGNESDYGDVGDDSGWGWMRLRDGGLLSIHTTTTPDQRETLAVMAAGGGSVLVVDDGASVVSWLAGSRDGQLVAVMIKEDEADEDWILNIFDVAAQELIEVDEDRAFDWIVINGDTLIYTAQMSDDMDDVETRTFDLVARGRPEVMYEDAVGIAPTGG